jgi:hypothetical protein
VQRNSETIIPSIALNLGFSHSIPVFFRLYEEVINCIECAFAMRYEVALSSARRQLTFIQTKLLFNPPSTHSILIAASHRQVRSE